MTGHRIGLLVMDYGTARDMDDVEAYYTHVRRGNPPPPHLLQELKDRYAEIGGSSPLMQRTEQQITGLRAALVDDEDREWVLYHGMKHQSPYLEDAVAQMASEGVTTAVGLVLAPHYSKFSVGEYTARVEKAAEGTALDFTFISHYHDDPAFIRMLATRIEDVRALIPEDHGRDDAKIIFTAHSLPARIVAAGDPYPEQLVETADLVAAQLGTDNYLSCWMSAGRTEEEWLGPDILATLARLGEEGQLAVIVCPCGFVSDHLEVLWDIDIDSQRAAREAEILLVRTESPNADPEFIEVLKGVVLRHASERGL
jgi:ferrochelatase